MLPISEFHFAFCGIATVAATLGYACARRAVLSLASSDEPSKADVEAGPSEERSLKRKLGDSDEHDADAEEQSRPMKRNRTPPVDDEWEVIEAPPPYEQVVGLRQPEQTAQDAPQTEGSHKTEQGNVKPVREPTPPAHPETSPQPDEKGVEVGCGATPEPPRVSPSHNEPGIPSACPMASSKPAVPAKAAPVNAFSAFSGSSSPFASYSNSSATSPFALSGQNIRTAPAWRRNNNTDVFGRSSSPDPLAPSPNDIVASTKTKSSALSQGKSTLRASSETRSLAKPSICLTGEEGETVEAELKGVKLFVKRGRKEFADGIYGHIKILTQRSAVQRAGNEDPVGSEAETQPRTRLLFRRDPLGQVSMNVGLRSAVRCHFDTAENILRIILMEQVKADGKDSKGDVVIYALKPGRAQKADFQSFAKVLCDHEGLKAGGTSLTTPASGVAAAS